MMEYVRYLSGHWQVSCTICGQQATFDTVTEAYTRGHSHEKVCGM
jgi:hypothetical protein